MTHDELTPAAASYRAPDAFEQEPVAVGTSQLAT